MMPWFAKRYRSPQPSRNGAIAVPREEGSDSATPDSSSAETRPDPVQRFGLIRLEPQHYDSQEGPYRLDIVAIHGLNGNAYTTWTKRGEPLWLQEDLPRSLPGSRVYSYSYDSKVWSSSKGEVRDWAKTLLNCLTSQRRAEKDKQRGIVFVCHSLGGIVCKRALIEANEDPFFSDILESTKAIVFFGTPHVGSDQADFASILINIAESMNAATFTDRITGHRLRRDLIHLLKNQSKELEQLSMSFRNRLKGIEIASFYEQDTMRGLRKLVVPPNSALLQYPDEHQLPSPGKDHQTMCQLLPHDDEYKFIVEMCEKYADKAANGNTLEPDTQQIDAAEQELERQERRYHEKDFEKQQKCLNAFRSVEIEMMDRRAHLPKPVPDTCAWILSYPNFQEWISSNRSDVLHLTGDMGSGKTTIMSFLVDHLKNHQQKDALCCNPKPLTVCSFFCSDQHHGFRDAVSVIRGILYQLFDQNEMLLRSMHSSLVNLGDVPVENWNHSLLWPRMEDALNSALVGPVVLVVDALDECEEKSISLLLDDIGRLFSHKSKAEHNFVKLLVSSRPSIHFKHNIQPFITTISVDTEEICERLQQDVNRFVIYEIGRLATAGKWTQEMSKVLGGDLIRKAGLSFLWARLILNRMENGSQDMLRLQKVINESPKDLDQFYCHILASIDDDNQDLAVKMLRVLVGALRPLTTKEFAMALAIISSDSQSYLLEEIEKARDRNIKQSIRIVLKSLAYVRGNKVQLYHPSTKEFLLRLLKGKVNRLDTFTPSMAKIYGISLHDANLCLSMACITFLGLDDFNEDIDKTLDETLSSFAELPAFMDDDDDDDALSSGLPDIPARTTLSSSSSEDEDAARVLSVKDKIQKHLFYAYSATYWTSHLRMAGPFATKELLESSIHISDPTGNCLMHWSDLYRSSSQEWIALPKPLDPLIISAFFGVVSLGNETLRRSANLDDAHKSLALSWACRMGHLDVVELLLAHKTSFTGYMLDGRYPISWACANGHSKIVGTLLKNDSESQINLLDSKKRSPLSLAVEFGDLATTKMLLAVSGVDPDLADTDGNTPIHWSVGSKMGRDDNRQLQKLLTVDEIDIAKRDKRGRTVLSWAAENGALTAIDILLHSKRPEIETLLNDTGDIYYGRSPLGYAAFYGYANIVEALCKTGKVKAQLDSIDHKGQNAALLAADRNNWEVIQVLAKYYPKSLDVPEQTGRTPLSAAMWADDNENNAKLIRTLIKNGVNVNTRSNDGRTPLHFAASFGRIRLMRILVEEGQADIDIIDNRGMLAEGSEVEINQKEVKDEFRRLRVARSAK